MSIGNGRKTYSDSTLKSMRKDELIDIIRCLERNKTLDKVIRRMTRGLKWRQI